MHLCSLCTRCTRN